MVVINGTYSRSRSFYQMAFLKWTHTVLWICLKKKKTNVLNHTSVHCFIRFVCSIVRDTFENRCCIHGGEHQMSSHTTGLGLDWLKLSEKCLHYFCLCGGKALWWPAGPRPQLVIEPHIPCKLVKINQNWKIFKIHQLMEFWNIFRAIFLILSLIRCVLYLIFAFSNVQVQPRYSRFRYYYAGYS